MKNPVEREELYEQQKKHCSPNRTRDNPTHRHFSVNHRLTPFGCLIYARDISRIPTYVPNIG